MLDCFIFAKLGCFVKQNKKYFYSGAVAADLLYKSVLVLCLIISRAVSYLHKATLNNIPSLCVHYDLYGSPIFVH